ncbi:BMC domain-containing protein [Acerihabitans sp. KWT182]|uniref:BMC domain-containing protein n=1 Tax=Acerihabitans sp. KWT182 TaxID=3157919 RepID=A0AAU7QDB8_9GAMM
MSGQSLGLIETVGLAVAVEAADAAMKSANVDLVGYELTKGGGLVTVKLTGEVGAMNAAVSAGVAAANRVGRVYAWKVIARTANGIDSLIASKETCGVALQTSAAEERPPVAEHIAVVIPVVNIEPVPAMSDCLEIRDEIPAKAPVSASPVTEIETPVSASSAIEAKAPVSEPPVTQVKPAGRDDHAESDAQPVPATLGEALEKTAQDQKKIPRTRAKGVRR